MSNPRSYEFLRTFIIFIGLLIQRIPFCLFGNAVTDKSMKVGDSCYETNWTECGPRVRKVLFIIMERSKRPTVFTAGKFVVLSLPLLVS
ncbi:hypothetical protein ILUMI_15497, partial [Ignelater luminosus]